MGQGVDQSCATKRENLPPSTFDPSRLSWNGETLWDCNIFLGFIVSDKCYEEEGLDKGSGCCIPGQVSHIMPTVSGTTKKMGGAK
ncbi:uncharacterized protein LOC116267451 isoform X2 [Nymphaea colorata]|uniref:uncharacterized protein LOC116267451 isoform X2 n=1 Tax=Nymphaea colorata TaxID=210225 RepID=UPI00129ED351|nr:uncharacterized protein LOC116267451 isoform X2 [Nymphaea colorata]